MVLFLLTEEGREILVVSKIASEWHQHVHNWNKKKLGKRLSFARIDSIEGLPSDRDRHSCLEQGEEIQ